MTEYSEEEAFGLKWLVLTGRIDAMSAGEIARRLDAFMTAGERMIGMDLDGVNYMSSAGIRVLLSAQKKLMRVNGQIVLARVRPDIRDILAMSGLDTLFRIGATRLKAAEAVGAEVQDQTPVSKILNDIPFVCLERDASPGSLTLIGDTRPLTRAAYDEQDVVTIPSNEMPFGLGLGSLGQEWDQFKGLFGEAMVIDHSLFFYPAVKNSAVDFMLWSRGNPPIPYRFLNGLAFQGAYRYVAAFTTGGDTPSLDDLIEALFRLSGAPLLGVVCLGESKGIWGMHLRHVPVKGFEEGPEEDIFSPARIHDWMDLPVEPGFVNHAVVCVGIAVRDRGSLPPPMKAYFPKDQRFHMHGGVFKRGLFSTDPAGFEQEILRVLTEFEPLRVQHLMGRSLFRNGIVGVVELEPGD